MSIAAEMIPEVSPWRYRLCRDTFHGSASVWAKECRVWDEGTWLGTTRGGCQDKRDPRPWIADENKLLAETDQYTGSTGAHFTHGWLAPGQKLEGIVPGWVGGCWDGPPAYQLGAEIRNFVYIRSGLGGRYVGRRDRDVLGCPIGSTQMGGKCVAPEAPVNDKNKGCRNDGTGIGNPCDVTTGNKVQVETDISGILSFVRTYNSSETRNLGLGIGWSSNRHKRLEIAGSGLIVRQADGRGEPWVESGGVWTGDADSELQLTADMQGYTVTLANGDAERYGPAGNLISETAANRLTTRYAYDTNNRLERVTGPFGHTLTFSYQSANGRLDTVTDGENRVYRYHGTSYNGSWLLTRLFYPDSTPSDSADNPTRIYHYAGRHLTGITDENGDRYATFGYRPDGKASFTQHAVTTNAMPQEKFSLSYDSATRTTVTDPVNEIWTYVFDENLGVVNLRSKTSQSDGKGIVQSFFAHNNKLEFRTDEEGRTTSYTYNATNQKETMTETVGTPQERTTTYEYHSPDIDLVTKVKQPSVAGTWRKKRVVTAYDAASLNPTSIAIRGFRPDKTKVERITRFIHNADHQLWRINGPRTDVADYTTFPRYPGCTTGAECGQIRLIRNALGHETKFDAYDGNGRVVRNTDPLGVVTTYGYDPRGRIETITQTPPTGLGSRRVTAYGYYGVRDQVRTVTMPDGVVLTYMYDAAHDLRSITDNLGNRVEYQYDARGNRKLAEMKDPNGTLVRTVSTVYDRRNRIESINAAGSITQTLRDAVGNIRTEIDPEHNPPTSHTPDALDRITETLDALDNPTRFQYDILDQPIQVVAPTGVTTNYVYDDLGNLLQETSPDRGTLVYSHDDAGNVKTVTDDRGVAVTYTYDALNRVTTVDYSGTTTEDIRFTYDSCVNGVGRLCKIVDHSGSTNYEYDVWGNVEKETKVENVAPVETHVTEYTYDAVDRVNTITYPSGRTVTYHRDPVGRIERVSSAVNGITADIVSGRAHRADGLVTEQTFANGLVESRQYDLKGRLDAQILTGFPVRDYDYDLNGNLELRTQGHSSHTYDYDALDRLIEDDGDPSPDYDYDANGNRFLKNSRIYTYVPGSNRLATDGGQTIRYDVVGNQTAGINGKTFAYYQSGRLKQYWKNAAAKATYVYNAFGQRTSKIKANGEVFVYHYDRDGRLIAETRNGKPHKDYVWVDDQPILQAQMRLSGGVLNETRRIYLVADHLNTPRLGLGETQTIIWRWDSDGFGATPPDSDPDGDGKKTWVNLRFPGQYWDAESGLFYNWHRYYDPKTGRYLTSDPVGLVAALNTYTYVGANPVNGVDPLGLYQMCHRDLQLPIPYARHCYARFSDGSTSSFDKNGVHPDPDPNQMGTVCTSPKEPNKDRCIKDAMQKCLALNYSFTRFNCCHCVEQALKECGASIDPSAWPNWPANPGPQAGEPGYSPHPVYGPGLGK